MNPREKAIEITQKFNPYSLDSGCDKARGGEYNAKQIAMLLCDEIILETNHYQDLVSVWVGEIENQSVLERLKYWNEVKQEIQKL